VAIAGLWITLAGLGGWIIDDAITGYRDAESRLANQARVYARMVASHDRFEIEMADQIIKSLLAHMDDELFNGEPDASRRAAFERLLAEHRSRLPGIASFSVLGADGIRRFGVAGKNFTDLHERGYFKALQAGKQETFVSPAESGLASGKPGIHVARAYRRPDGNFGGLVVINLSVEDIFRPYYATLGLEGARVQLRSADRVLMVYPAEERLAPMQPLSDALTPLMQAGHERGLIGDDAWVSAFERLPASSIYAEASLSRQIALKAPRNAAALAISALLAALLAGVALTRAITGNLRAQTELALAYANQRRMAIHDKLTGLPNRHYIDERFETIRAGFAATGHSAALIVVDLDHFKAVNDNLGHHAGDELLQEVARRLRTAGGDSSTAIRMGGDEFVVLVDIGPPGDAGLHRVRAISQAILDVFRPPFELGCGPVAGGASLGVARLPEDGIDWDTLSHKADVAMYRSKEAGRACFTIYESGFEVPANGPA
jgi:diguanylate cyclase (GGDEF)-like protein